MWQIKRNVGLWVTQLSLEQVTNNTEFLWKLRLLAVSGFPAMPGTCQYRHQAWEWLSPPETQHFCQGHGTSLLQLVDTFYSASACPTAKLPPRWIFHLACWSWALGMRIPSRCLEVCEDAGEEGQVPTPVYRVCSTTFSSLKVTTESGSLCPFTDAWHLMV